VFHCHDMDHRGAGSNVKKTIAQAELDCNTPKAGDNNAANWH